MIPEPVLDAISERTGMDFRGAPRRIRRRTCPRCGWPALIGLDADMCAGLAAVDPVPLTPFGEALALVRGMDTYVVHSYGGRWVIDRRDPWQRAVDAAGTLRHADVVPDHRCGYRWPGPTIAMTRLPMKVTETLLDEPPF